MRSEYARGGTQEALERASDEDDEDMN
jgi:hypothetical protein